MKKDKQKILKIKEQIFEEINEHLTLSKFDWKVSKNSSLSIEGNLFNKNIIVEICGDSDDVDKIKMTLADCDDLYFSSGWIKTKDFNVRKQFDECIKDMRKTFKRYKDQEEKFEKLIKNKDLRKYIPKKKK